MICGHFKCDVTAEIPESNRFPSLQIEGNLFIFEGRGRIYWNGKDRRNNHHRHWFSKLQIHLFYFTGNIQSESLVL